MLSLHVKSEWWRIKNFKIHSGYRKKHTIESPFCFIPISQAFQNFDIDEGIMNGIHFFLEMRATSFQESRLSCVRVSDKDGDRKWSKITLFFTRRYLENRRTYRDKWRSVSKGKVPRFWWSFASWPEVIILRVTAVQIFPNFNRSLIESR